MGCLLYPLGWNNAEVLEACSTLAHRYSWGQRLKLVSHRAYGLYGQARTVYAYGHPKTAAVSSLLASQRC